MNSKHKMKIMEDVFETNSEMTESKTDRQELITWWKQSALRNAKVLVVGAGAIGNELLKNLALLGIGYVVTSDMDHISASNLSRTVLFTADDLGKQKALVAAQRYKDMCVEPSAAVDFFDGNVVSDLGLGVLRRMDIIVGCLDNLQTRFETSRRCVLLQKPYIDAGISELTWSLTESHYPHSGCWSCSMTSQLERAAMMFERHSCDVTKARALATGHAPTTQVASAMVASLQAQDIVKYLVRTEWERSDEEIRSDAAAEPPKVSFGTRFSFDGKTNTMMATPFSTRLRCCEENHHSYDEITETEMSADWTLRQMFGYVRQRYGEGFYLSLYGDNRYQKAAFVTTGRCRRCGKAIDIYKSQKHLTDADLFCSDCHSGTPKMLSEAIEKVVFYEKDDERILELSLHQIGIPYLHIIELYRDEDGATLALELTADLPRVLPNYVQKV